jgi:hypothetical protein
MRIAVELDTFVAGTVVRTEFNSTFFTIISDASGALVSTVVQKRSSLAPECPYAVFSHNFTTAQLTRTYLDYGESLSGQLTVDPKFSNLGAALGFGYSLSNAAVLRATVTRTSATSAVRPDR